MQLNHKNHKNKSDFQQKPIKQIKKMVKTDPFMNSKYATKS